VLFYLNEGMTGGETSFPRWLNAESAYPLKVKPEVGKAILFYNQLPDGNYDERSQHAALPILEGEKWLTNLWVWVSAMILSTLFILFWWLTFLLCFSIFILLVRTLTCSKILT
jgi:hypothetical protein